MLWTVLPGVGTGRERTLAGLRPTHERVKDKSLVPSSFCDRISRELARMFRAVLSELMTKRATSEVRYSGVLEGFRDVLIADATVAKGNRLVKYVSIHSASYLCSVFALHAHSLASASSSEISASHLYAAATAASSEG